MDTALLLAAVVAAAITLYLFLVPGAGEGGRHRTRDYDAFERPAMPAVLANARLALSEVRLTTELPVPLVARVDQVYVSDGLAIPVDTKRRRVARAYPYDIVEVSVQAVVMRRARPQALRGALVAQFGFIRVVTSDTAQPTYLRIELLSEEQLVEIARRRQALLSGTYRPLGPSSARICSTCGHRDRCSYRPSSA